MMDNFIDLIKSSRGFLENCIELCDSLENDFISNKLTNESKEEKINKMMEGFQKVSSNITVAKTRSIKTKCNTNNLKYSNGDQKLKHATIALTDIIQNSNKNENNDQNTDHMEVCEDMNNINSIKCTVAVEEESFIEKDNENSPRLNIDQTITEDGPVEDVLGEKIPETKIIDKIPETKIIDKIPETKIIDKIPEIIIIDNDEQEDCDEVEMCFIDDKENESITDLTCNEDDTVSQIYNDLKPCSIILEDIIKSNKKTGSDEDYFNDLEAEVQKLSKIPKAIYIKSQSEKEDKVKNKKAVKEKLKTITSTVFQSDSEGNDSDSELSDHSVHINLSNTAMVDTPLSTTESDPSTDESNEFKPESKSSNGKVRFSDNKTARRITRSLKIPLMSDSDVSVKTGLSNDKSKKKTRNKAKDVVSLSSGSEDESDASVTNLRGRNNNKRKKSSKVSTKSKRQKIDDDDEKEDDSEDNGEKRKKIRKIMTKSKLSEATKAAEQLEIERRKRMEEKQQIYNSSIMNKDALNMENVTQLILEKDQTGESIVEVHSYIAEKLKPHQVEAVHFMYECVIENVQCLLKSQEEKEEQSSSVGGCILAHCMGLGKTLSLIAFMHTMLTTPILNLYSCIVVCPVNTALNWKKEWEMWMPSDRPVKLFELCSSETKKYKITIVQDWHKKGGVLIIGYEMFRLLTAVDNRTIRNKAVRTKLQEALIDPGADFIVCDEGHLLKNEKSAISKVINKVKTKCRIVLTGTPLQNRLVEYHTMVNFVKPNLLGTQKEFLNRFVNPICNGQHINSTPYDVKIMKKRSHILFKTLDGCVHRRDYSALVKYLPPKYEYIIKIRMSEVQMTLYRIYLSKIKINRNSLFQDQTTFARIWTHPFLICMHQEIQDKKMFLAETEDDFTDDSNDNDSDNKKKKPSKPPLEENNMVNLISDDSDSSNEIEKMEVDKKKTEESEYSESSAEEVVKKWSTSTRSTRRRIIGSDDEEGQKLNFELEDLKETVPVDKHWWSDVIKPEYEHQIEMSGKLTVLFQILRKAGDMGDKVIVFSHSLLVLEIIEKYLFQLHTIAEKVNSDLLKLNESVSTERPEIPEINEEAKAFFPEIGYNTWEKGIDYDRMDGSTHVFARADIQSRFNDEKERRLRLFLISTRAGGMGVNLVAANRVIIFDVSWNPSNDIQAIFRSYRFGQSKPVYVYRLVSQGTMEEKMYERQVTKQSLSLRVVDEQQIGRYFTEEDLRSLYKFEPDIYDSNKERVTPILPKDRFLAELIQEFPQWIFGYHEHDSLLQNNEEEELTEAERQEAWKEFEDEKLHGNRPNNMHSIHPAHVTFDHNQFAQLQMAQMQQQFPQYAAIYAQNYLNLLRYAIGQQPDLKYNPSELSVRMQSVFFMSLQKYNNSNAAQAAAVATPSTSNVVAIAPKRSEESTSKTANQ